MQSRFSSSPSTNFVCEQEHVPAEVALVLTRTEVDPPQDLSRLERLSVLCVEISVDALSKERLDVHSQQMANHKIVRVGIIGCGEITQVAHIPTLGFLSDLFTITYLCDVSAASLEYNAQKVINHVPRTTQDPAELCASPDVDLVFVASSDEYHAVHAIQGLRHDKHVFIEKPMALCTRDADAIIAAEERSKGKVMVGYMRRYAAAFLDMVEEVGGLDKILYARVRGELA
jgi:hypothetical protein